MWGTRGGPPAPTPRWLPPRVHTAAGPRSLPGCPCRLRREGGHVTWWRVVGGKRRSATHGQHTRAQTAAHSPQFRGCSPNTWHGGRETRLTRQQHAQLSARRLPRLAVGGQCLPRLCLPAQCEHLIAVAAIALEHQHAAAAQGQQGGCDRCGSAGSSRSGSRGCTAGGTSAHPCPQRLTACEGSTCAGSGHDCTRKMLCWSCCSASMCRMLWQCTGVHRACDIMRSVHENATLAPQLTWR